MNRNPDPYSQRPPEAGLGGSGVESAGSTISAGAIVLLLGLLSGSIAALIHVWSAFGFGVSLNLWPVCTFVSVSGLTSWTAAGFPRQPVGLFVRWALLIGLIGSSVWFAARVYGVNWDGMLAHKEFVVALDRGWNPLEDPYRDKDYRKDRFDWELYAQYKGLSNGGFEVRHGFVLGALGAGISGNPESGKFVHFLYAIIASLAVWHFWTKAGLSGWKKWVYTAACVLNPVILVQMPSFWLDGQVASLVTSAVFLALSVRYKGRLLEWLALAMVLILLSDSKRAGIALSIWILAGVLLSFFPYVLKWSPAKRRIRLYCLGGFLVAIGVLLFLPYGQQAVVKAEHFVEKMASLQRIGDWEWVSEAQRKGMQKLTRLNGFEQFLASSISEGTIVPTDVNPKVPIAFTARERSVYYHGFAGPWFGGFGPWFGLTLFVAAGLLMIRPALLKGLPGGVGFWMLWLWMPLFLLPGIFARWIPWMWLFPVLCAVSYDHVMTCARSCAGCSAPRSWWLSSRSIWVNGLGIVTLCVLILNSGVVWGLNVAGHIRSSGILKEQLVFLATQADKPLDVYFKDFPSNRTWLDQAGIPYSPTLAPVPDRWQLRLYRSTTSVFLPAGQSPDDPVVIEGRSVSLRDLAARWDARGKGDPSWPWIGSSLIEPIKAKKDPIRSSSGRRPKQSQ